MGVRRAPSSGHGQAPLGAFPDLDLGFFIEGQDDFRRESFFVETHDAPHFLFEVRGVGPLEGARAGGCTFAAAHQRCHWALEMPVSRAIRLRLHCACPSDGDPAASATRRPGRPGCRSADTRSGDGPPAPQTMTLFALTPTSPDTWTKLFGCASASRVRARWTGDGATFGSAPTAPVPVDPQDGSSSLWGPVHTGP